MAAGYVPYEGPLVTRADALASGKKRYFTGRPCKHGHISERYLASKICLACMSARRDKSYHDRYYQENRERLIAAQAARNAANPERRKQYYQANKEAEKLKARRWREENPDRVKAAQKATNARNAAKMAARYQENKETILVRQAAWKALHPEARRAHKAVRRARKLKAAGAYTASDVKDLMELQGGKCAHSWCRVSLKEKYHVDHVVPISKGGANEKRNLQLLCPPCNLRKHAKHPIDFARENGMLL